MKRTVIGAGAAILAVVVILARGGDSPEEVNFSEHVAPIVYRSCLPCHRTGESAPFQLLEYEEVAKRARQIAEVTGSRYMPPWMPSAPHGVFVGDRSLSAEEIATIERWFETGSPEGDPEKAPPVPPATGGWYLGEPDLIVTMPEPFVVPKEGIDVFRNFVLPIPVERPRFVEALELSPSNKRVAHHAVMGVDRTRASRERDVEDAEPGFPGMDLGQAEAPQGHFLGWTPGRVPLRSAEGTAWRLEPGNDLVVQLHMVTTGKLEPIKVSVGFFFTDHPPTQRLMVLTLRNDDIDIPAGESEYVAEDSLILPVDVAVTRLAPHAHYLGKRMEAFAELPDGSRRDLILIEDWDFNWQDVYEYESPVTLPKGSRLTMRYTFDNSAENPRNPRIPPQRVRVGNLSLDEMATLTLQLMIDSAEDRRALLEAERRHRIEQNPEDWGARLNLGAMLAKMGQFEEAAMHLRAGLAVKPDNVLLHMNLGAVLASIDEVSEARQSFEEALRLRPGDPEVHSNLAVLEERLGRWDEAVEQYRAVLESSPRDARAHRGLGSALIRLERLDEAAAAFEKALAHDPSDYQSHYELGRIAFVQGRLEEATKAFLAGLEIRPLPQAHADLARIYRARGMRAEARLHSEEARRLSGQKRPE